MTLRGRTVRAAGPAKWRDVLTGGTTGRSCAGPRRLGGLFGQLVGTQRRELDDQPEAVAYLLAKVFGPAL